jgi:hypothetical protein
MWMEAHWTGLDVWEFWPQGRQGAEEGTDSFQGHSFWRCPVCLSTHGQLGTAKLPRSNRPFALNPPTPNSRSPPSLVLSFCPVTSQSTCPESDSKGFSFSAFFFLFSGLPSPGVAEPLRRLLPWSNASLVLGCLPPIRTPVLSILVRSPQ